MERGRVAPERKLCSQHYSSFGHTCTCTYTYMYYYTYLPYTQYMHYTYLPVHASTDRWLHVHICSCLLSLQCCTRSTCWCVSGSSFSPDSTPSRLPTGETREWARTSSSFWERASTTLRWRILGSQRNLKWKPVFLAHPVWVVPAGRRTWRLHRREASPGRARGESTVQKVKPSRKRGPLSNLWVACSHDNTWNCFLCTHLFKRL